MMMNDMVTLVFFFAHIVIFFAKLLNLMSFKQESDEPTLKLYGLPFALVFLMVSLIAWVIMLAAFSAVAVDSSFFWNNDIPSAAYVEYSLYFQLSSLMMVVISFFTILEAWIFLTDKSKTRTDRDRRESFTERGIRLPTNSLINNHSA